MSQVYGGGGACGGDCQQDRLSSIRVWLSILGAGMSSRPRPTPSHSWDRPATPWGEGDVDGFGPACSDSDAEVIPPTTAGDDFVSCLLGLFNERTLNARQLCELCWHASAAGVRECAPYKFRPGAPSGHYQRHLDKVIASRVRDARVFCEVQVPVTGSMISTRHSTPSP